MKLGSLLIVLVSTFVAFGVADSLSEIASQLPSCGLKCTVSGIAASGCGLNATCMCTSATLTANVTACLTEECSVRDALTSAKIFAGSCNRPVRDISGGLLYAPMPLGVLAVLLVTLRIYGRLFEGLNGLGWDDYTIIAACIVGIPFTLLGITLKEYGFGKDIFQVPFDDLTKMFMTFYIDEQFYFLVLTLTKISILCFYLRVFPDQAFRRVVHIMIAINIAWGITANGITIFQCWPISYYWNRWDGTYEGHCNSASIQAWITALANIALDISIMILPIPNLLKLQLKWQRKLNILVMFGVGIFVTIVSAVRLDALEKFSTSTNPTYDNVPAAYWSAIEGNTSIICACLPAIRSLISKSIKRAKEYSSGVASKVTKKSMNSESTQNTAESQLSNSARGKTPRLSTLRFKGTNAQDTFVELENYPTNTDTIDRMNSFSKTMDDQLSDDGSEQEIIRANAGRVDWEDSKQTPKRGADLV